MYRLLIRVLVCSVLWYFIFSVEGWSSLPQACVWVHFMLFFDEAKKAFFVLVALIQLKIFF